MKKKPNIHIIILLTVLFPWAKLSAQESGTQPLMPGEKPKPTQYIAIEEKKEHLVFFQGFTLSLDAYGPIAYCLSDYGTAEAALRLNLKNTFFPIIEAGYGICEKTDFNTQISYKTKAPYARLGLDINMLTNKFQENRFYIGARYGLSKYKYDIAGPAMSDPIWGGSESFNYKGLDCTSHWLELVVGIEVKIYKNFHMGWAVRYKSELSSTNNKLAKPSCIPGYGYTTNSTCWGGTYSLIFDLNWGMKKSHKKGVNMELRDIPQKQTEDTNTFQTDFNNKETMYDSEKAIEDGE